MTTELTENKTNKFKRVAVAATKVGKRPNQDNLELLVYDAIVSLTATDTEVSMRNIASQINKATPTIYYYFKGKKGILEMVFEKFKKDNCDVYEFLLQNPRSFEALLAIDINSAIDIDDTLTNEQLGALLRNSLGV